MLKMLNDFTFGKYSFSKKRNKQIKGYFEKISSRMPFDVKSRYNSLDKKITFFTYVAAFGVLSFCGSFVPIEDKKDLESEVQYVQKIDISQEENPKNSYPFRKVLRFGGLGLMFSTFYNPSKKTIGLSQ